MRHTCKIMISLGFACLFAMGGCVHKKPVETMPFEEGKGLTRDELVQLSQKNEPKQKSKKGLGGMRTILLRDTALSLGARAGLADQAKDLNKMLEGQKAVLGQVYDFRALLLKHNVLPPVIIKGDTSLHRASAKILRLADETYEIIAQAQFVTNPPTWRDYLTMNFDHPKKPHRSLLPKNNNEEKVWVKYIDEGWKKCSNKSSFLQL